MNLNDQGLAITRERISYFLDLLARLRVSCRLDEFPLVAGGYRTDVERMQEEMLNYLTRHTTQTTAKAG